MVAVGLMGAHSMAVMCMQGVLYTKECNNALLILGFPAGISITEDLIMVTSRVIGELAIPFSGVNAVGGVHDSA